MIRSLARLGQVVPRGADDLKPYVHELPPLYTGELTVIYEELPGDVLFVGTQSRQRDSSRAYLFRPQKGNVPVPATPTIPYPGEGEKAARRLANFFSGTPHGWMGDVHKDLSNRVEQIGLELDRASKNARFGERVFVTFVLRKNGQEKYPGEVDEIRNVFRTRVADKGGGTDGVCYTCGMPGKVSAVGSEIFKFSTFDKPCFAVGIRQEFAWRNYPLCKSCRTNLESGRRYLDAKMDFQFYKGSMLWIVPKPVLLSDQTLRDILLYVDDISPRIRGFLDRREASGQLAIELGIAEVLAEAQEWMGFDLVFHRSNKGQEQVLLYIEDIMPSRFSAISEKRRFVDTLLSTYSFPVEGGTASPRVRLETLYRVLCHRNALKTFFAYVDGIFRGARVDPRPLVGGFLSDFGPRLSKAGSMYPSLCLDVLEVWAMLLIFLELGLNERMEGGVSEMTYETTSSADLTDDVQRLFAKFQGFFTSPERKEVFLMGVLTRKLLDLQWRERRSAPFTSKLRGLKMSKSDVEGLLPEIMNKLAEYDKQYASWRKLETIIAAEALAAGRKWEMSADEMNFIFAVGLALGQEKPFKKEEVEDERPA